ncbi:hypothetical protein DFJ77DRAFT_61115 [Powellomyces hirtus]|nr:hypothetical protein DFJ77DRAFT_61115 [Powellomyces hirtus]
MFSMDRWWLRDWGGTGNLTELETQLGWPAFFTWDWMNANNDNYEFHNATDHRGIPLTPAQKDILMSGYDAHNNTKPGTPHFVQWLTVISDYWVWFPFDSRPGSTTERGGWGKGRYNSTIDETYAYMQGSNPAPEGHEFWSYSPIGDTIQGYVGVNIYSNPLTPTIPSHLCQAGGAFKNSLDPYLRQSVPSENGIVLLIDSAKMNRDKTYHPGYIIATSVVGANTDGLRPYNDTMFGLDTSPSPTVREVGSILRSRYPSLNMTGLQTFSAPVPSTAQQWHIATLSLNPDRANHTWQIVVAFPHSDYFSTIDKSIRDAVLIIVVLTVVALVAITAMSVAVTVPLSGIAKRMDEVTSMKFSSIESGVLDRRSYVREIASLENTFQIMVQAFAAAIRKNADLIGTQRRGNMRR